MPPFHPDTIVAIVTPLGEGGIAVLRLSGEEAITKVDEVFHGKQRLATAASHTAHVGKLLDDEGNMLDEVVVTVFRAPHSYTVEDVAEVSCHGSVFIARKILESFIRRGVRPAEPGEFTKRAFLNGRIDLSQAEAVAELIHARSDSAHKASLQQLRGLHSIKFLEIKDAIMRLCGLLELELDFSEEGISLIEISTTEKIIQELIVDVTQLIDSYKVGKVVRDGIKVVLIGRPNVGKSSLLNSLLNEERSIVTEISGTTRDTIEEAVHLSGYYVRVVDTAGLRATTDPVEVEGIRRTEAEIEDADVVAYVLDAGRKDIIEDGERVRSISAAAASQGKSFLLLANKIDLIGGELGENLTNLSGGMAILPVSAKSGKGIDSFRKTLSDLCLSRDYHLEEKSVIITNARHQASLLEAREALCRALASIQARQSNEFIAVDLRAALRHVGEIIGNTTTDDILNRVFASFCIGK